MIYAIAISASRWNTAGQLVGVLNVVITQQASSEDEAVGMGLRIAKERWLESRGYYSHLCEAIKVPEDWYAN